MRGHSGNLDYERTTIISNGDRKCNQIEIKIFRGKLKIKNGVRDGACADRTCFCQPIFGCSKKMRMRDMRMVAIVSKWRVEIEK